MAQRGALPVKPRRRCCGDRVDLDDDAVDLVAERVAEGLGFGDEGQHLVEVLGGAGVGVDPEAAGAEGFESGGLAREEGLAGRVEEEVGVEVEAALRDDVGLERADGAGGGVARVCGGSLAGGFALLVELAEGCLRKHDLAPDLEVRRHAGGLELCGGDAERDGADGADVRGDVLADGAIAAREAALEVGGAVVLLFRAEGRAVVEGERQAVELELADVAGLLGGGERVADAGLPGAEFGLVVGVIEREHGARVRRFEEAVAGLATDALAGRVGRDQIRVLGLERLETLHQVVVLGIGEYGRVEHVVQVLVVAELVAEGFDLLLRSELCGGHRGRL